LDTTSSAVPINLENKTHSEQHAVSRRRRAIFIFVKKNVRQAQP
jgi:hypothetical protein